MRLRLGRNEEGRGKQLKLDWDAVIALCCVAT